MLLLYHEAPAHILLRSLKMSKLEIDYPQFLLGHSSVRQSERTFVSTPFSCGYPAAAAAAAAATF